MEITVSSARMIRTDPAIYLFPRLPCGGGSLSFCDEVRLVGECTLHLIRSDSNPQASASQVCLWRRLDR